MDHRHMTDRPPTLDRYSTVNVLAECRPLYRPTYRSSIGRHIGRHTGRHIGRHIDRCSTNTPRPICRSQCRPTYRSSVGRYVDRHIDRYVGRDVDRHIGRGVRKLHMIQNDTQIKCSTLNRTFSIEYSKQSYSQHHS